MTAYQNCWYALWQVREQQTAGLFFIDAICIHQSDLEEKAAQVRKISTIFKGASLIFACVGPPAYDSDFLFDCLQNLLPVEASESLRLTALSSVGLDEETQQRTINALVALDHSPRFANALKCFSRRTFFSHCGFIKRSSLHPILLCYLVPKQRKCEHSKM